MNKNEIVESLADRGIFACKQNVILNLIKKLKMFNVYQDYLEFKVQNYKQTYEIPFKYLNQDLVFERILDLDEADLFVKRDLFAQLKGVVHSVSIDYWAWHARSFFKPILEFWDFNVRVESFTGILTPQHNPALFEADILQKIFMKFAIP